ncbi:hypothetical protein B0O99DRAFT_588649 [Bisporella sp. PMI_857]|nr:hypothetical protein B0O99DRAFT_588649 [Bisporella sp. PMI_857]
MPPIARGVKLRTTCDACTESKRAGRHRTTAQKAEGSFSHAARTADITAWEASSTDQDWTMDNSALLYQGYSQHQAFLDINNMSPARNDSVTSFLLPEFSILESFNGEEMDIQHSWEDDCGRACDVIDAEYGYYPVKFYTHEARFPVDLYLVQGRQAAENYRTVSIYERARVEHFTALSKRAVGNVGLLQQTTQGSSVSSQTNNYGSLYDPSLDSNAQSQVSSPNISRGSPLGSKPALAQQSAFIGAYRLDDEDEIKLKFDIVYRHLLRLKALIQEFSKAVQHQNDAIPMTESKAFRPESAGMIDNIIMNEHISAHSGLGRLLQRRFEILHHDWEKFYSSGLKQYLEKAYFKVCKET